MREVVKVVNGYEITRLKGTRGFYEVIIKTFVTGGYKYKTFKTIKAAVAFCESL